MTDLYSLKFTTQNKPLINCFMLTLRVLKAWYPP